MHIASIGIDLGKTTFHLVALGEHNKILLRKKFSRLQLLAYTANLPASLIGLEACAGAHFRGAALRSRRRHLTMTGAFEGGGHVSVWRGNVWNALSASSSCTLPLGTRTKCRGTRSQVMSLASVISFPSRFFARIAARKALPHGKRTSVSARMGHNPH